MAEFVETKRKSSGCGKYFFLVFLLILLLLGGFGWWKYYYNFSEGNRTGMLQKFSHKGNIMKTYEGELLLSSVTSTTTGVGLASEKFYFSVANDSVARALMNMEGRWVKLHYTQKNGALPWVGETPYIVDGFSEDQSPLAPQVPGYYQQPNQQYQQPQQQAPQQYEQPPQQYQQQQPQQYQQPQQTPPQQYQQQQPQQQYPPQNTPVQPQTVPQQQPQQQQQQQQPAQQLPVY